VNSGSIIRGKGSGRPLALYEIDSKGNYELYYFELEEVIKHSRKPVAKNLAAILMIL